MNTTALLVLGLVVGYAVLVVVMNVRERLQDRRLRARLPSQACPSCGGTYGPEVVPTCRDEVALADPGGSLHFVRVTCPRCSREVLYHRNGELAGVAQA